MPGADQRRQSKWAVWKFAVPLIVPAVGALLSFSCSSPGAESEVVRVGAASAMQFVLPRIAAQFTAAEGIRIQFIFASSGAIASQIRNGAPIDLFISADESWINGLLQENLLRPESVEVIAQGSLVVAWSPGAKPPEALEDLAGDGIRRIGIANPDLAPFGRAAREALVRLGLWHQVKGKLAYGASVAHAASYLRSGSVDCAFLPLSLAQEDHFPYFRVEPSMFSPIRFLVAIPRRSVNLSGAGKFAEHLLAEGQPLLREHGFALGGD